VKSRQDKRKDFEALRQELEKSPAIFVTGFERLTVQQDYELRKSVRGAGGSYSVLKNNIAEKASENLPSNQVLGNLRGMSSIAYTTGDPVALAKALTTYAKDHPAFTFKAGFVEGRAVDIAGIQNLANMPSKEELIAKIMFLINCGAQRIAVALNGVSRNLAVVLDQARQEGKFPG
jgi:large subunit ribosomal protein L10